MNMIEARELSGLHIGKDLHLALEGGPTVTDQLVAFAIEAKAVPVWRLDVGALYGQSDGVMPDSAAVTEAVSEAPDLWVLIKMRRTRPLYSMPANSAFSEYFTVPSNLLLEVSD